MSDSERLKDKLGKLSEGPAGTGFDASSESAALRSLALLIDETILPRRISLETGAATVELTVSKRRLISVSGDVSAAFDEDEADGTLRRLGRDLAKCLAGRTVSIRSERAGIPPELQGAGPGVESIAEAWNVELYRATRAPEAEDEIAGLLKSKAYAWVTWKDGTETDHGGDPDYLKALKKKISPQSLRARHGGPKGLVALGGNGFATVIGLAWDGASQAAFVMARIDLAGLARALAAR